MSTSITSAAIPRIQASTTDTQGPESLWLTGMWTTNREILKPSSTAVNPNRPGAGKQPATGPGNHRGEQPHHSENQTPQTTGEGPRQARPTYLAALPTVAGPRQARPAYLAALPTVTGPRQARPAYLAALPTVTGPRQARPACLAALPTVTGPRRARPAYLVALPTVTGASTSSADVARRPAHRYGASTGSAGVPRRPAHRHRGLDRLGRRSSPPCTRRSGVGVRRRRLGACAASARSMCFPPSRCSGTRWPWCTTRTGSATRRWRRSRGGPTCRRRRSCWRRPTSGPTTGCGSSRRARSCRSPGTRRSGSAHAWLEAGGQPRNAGENRPGVRCGAGPAAGRRAARLRRAAAGQERAGGRRGPRAAIVGSLGINDDEVVDMAWADNGPGWVAVLLESAEGCSRCSPDFVAWATSTSGWSGPHTGDERRRRRGARVLPRHGHRRGPGHRAASTPRSASGWPATASPRRTSRRRVRRSVAAAGSTSTSTGDTLWVGGDALTTITGRVGL